MKLKRCEKGHIYDEIKNSNCPYCKVNINYEKVEEKEIINEKTILYVEEKERELVGWLVCIYGPEKGKDYKIYSEKNFIGRAQDMEISIKLDKNIEDRNHCFITYNPKQRRFVISPGEAKSIIYVRNKAIYETNEIFNYDILEIGNSRFIFIALCGTNFDWDL